MALNVQFYKVHNYLTNEDIVLPRLVNQQTLDFNALCEYLADGSTVTAADVSAVMKQIEMRIPLVLALNAKVVCSPEGLTFRPKVSGSLTQKQLKTKLESRLASDPTLDIDVNRPISVSDLSVNDLTAEIGIEMPKKWQERFKSKAEFKRVTVTTSDDSGSGSGNGSGNDNVNVNDNEGGGGSGSGSGNGSGNDNGNQNNGGSSTPSTPKLTINKSGTGTATVSVGGNAVSSGAEIAADTEVAISVTPAEGATPTATLNGSSVTLTENDGVYTGTFTMPSASATLSINTGGSSGGGVDQN